MTKVRLHEDEKFPVYGIDPHDKRGRQADIPDSLIAEYWKAEREFWAVQELLEEYWYESWRKKYDKRN